VLELAPGQSMRFGRATPRRHGENPAGPALGMAFDHDSVSRLAGEITATENYWTLTNFSRDATYVVENPEGGGEFVKVPPLRHAAPVPFEISRVLLPTAPELVAFHVYAPMHAFLDEHSTETLDGEMTLASFPLDTSAKYFLVLLALCEPRLRDESHVVIPGVDAVVERLRPLPSCRTLNTGAVNFHIDYLARRKLRIKQPQPGGRPERFDARREMLVSVALRFNLVREEHLAMLPAHFPHRSAG
jgi:hypothetical protein